MRQIAPAPRGDLVIPLVTVVIIASTVFAIYWPTLASMAAAWWRSETFKHGILVLPIAGWLLYRQRYCLAASQPRVAWWGMPPLAICCLLWMAGSLVQVDVLRHLAMMLMVPMALLLVLGPAALASVAFPVAFSLLAVPAGEFLIPPMMDLTASGSVLLLRASGVPVYQDGWLISIPEGSFQVAEACSGVRYLIGATTTGILFAWLFFSSFRKRIIFMGFVIILTVLANVMRAYIIVFLAHLSDMRLAVGVDHFIYGWFLFSVLLLLVFGVGLRFADHAIRTPASAGAQFTLLLRRHAGRHVAAAIAALALLLAAPVLQARLESPGGAAAPILVPARAGGARVVTEMPAPGWLRTDTGWQQRHVRFEGGAGPFEVHVFKGGPGPDGRDVAALRDQLAGDAVTLVSDEPVALGTGAGEIPIRQMRLQQGGQRFMVASWFVVGGRRTANPVTAKLMEVRTILGGGHKKPALVAVALDTNGLDRPGDSLHAIVAELANPVSSCLESALRDQLECVSSVAGTDQELTITGEGRLR